MEAATALLDWARVNGCVFPRVDVAFFEGYGLGLRAVADIPAGCDAVVVPLKLLINEDTVKLSAFYSALSHSAVELTDPYHLLYAFMLYEKAKGRDGFWWPYWNALPADVGTAPSLSDAELAPARGTNIFEQVRTIRKQMAQLSKKLAPLVASRPDLLPSASPKELVWCYQIVWSRALSVLWPPGDRQVGCLVPLVDMLNHSPTAHVSYLTHFAEGVFSIRQQQGIAAGEQVFLNYGSRSNEKMVLNYGFHDAKPFGSDVLTFNERAFIADGDLTALLAELRRVCEGDETSTLLMLHDLLRQRLERMAGDIEGDSLLAQYARSQRQILLDARHALFTELLPALWASKAKPAEPDEWYRAGPLNNGDVLVSFPWSDCRVDEEDEDEVVPPIDRVPVHSEHFIVNEVVRQGVDVSYVVEGISGRIGGQFVCE